MPATTPMKIAVCLKQVITRDTHVRPNASATWIREDGASWALNLSLIHI